MFALESIKIKNFRCFEAKNQAFLPQKNVIIGKNATGKTTLVEAIYYLCFARSFKGEKDQNLVKNGEKNFFLEGFFDKNDEKDVVSAAYDGQKKEIFVNDAKIKSLSEFVGRICAVSFCPDDLNMIKLEPKRRRKFLDASISQIDKKYLMELAKANKIYKEKSVYLHSCPKNEVNYNYLRALNEEYISSSIYIIRKRNEFLIDLEQEARQICALIGEKEDLFLRYKPNTSVDDLKKVSEEKLEDDVYAKTTTWGPLRDDVDMYLGERSVQTSASQGQTRTVAIALKLALAEIYKKKDASLVVILDDVLSELDKTRQNALLSIIGKEQQVFITATDTSAIEESILDGANVITLLGG